MCSTLAPICLFVYNRIDETKQTIEALRNNYLASESELFIFSDGSKKNGSTQKVQNVRDFIATVDGFKSVKVIEAKTNNGLANSIINGVSEVISKYGKVIVLEDDLITSANFLNFMNQALTFYEEEKKVFSISGFTLDLKTLKIIEKDFYWGFRASSWGWATWDNRWINVDWDVKDYEEFIIDRRRRKEFRRKRGSDMVSMLKAQKEKRIDSWAIRWCYSQYKENSLTLFPKTSKVFNIGMGINATNTKLTGRFNQKLDSGDQVQFNFLKKININDQIISDFLNYHSIVSRIYWKMISLIRNNLI